MKEKIAIIVDSGSDVNEELRNKYNIQSLPLRIQIDDNEYTDGIDITREKLFSQIDKSHVSTSLPSGEDIIGTFEKLKESGVTHVIVVAISSGLSGTYNVVHNLTQEVEGLEFFVLDTKNISLASGFLAIEAAKMRDTGASFKEISLALEEKLDNSKVFFTVGTLDYLIRGGRIGLVAGTLANVLNIKPIITCNEDGIYHTINKVRGYKRVIYKMIDTAFEFVKDSTDYTVAILNADTKENLDEIIQYAKDKYNHDVMLSNITPALAIHTGPEALGIAVYKNN